MLKFLRTFIALIAFGCLIYAVLDAALPLISFVLLVLLDDLIVHLESKRYWRTNK